MYRILSNVSRSWHPQGLLPCRLILRHCCGKDKDIVLPEEPTNCCMSGCANCVWIDYAKELTRIYADGGSKAQKLILAKISDPTLKVFLQMELKSLAKTNSA